MNFNEFVFKCCDYLNEIFEDVKVSRLEVVKNNGLKLCGLQFKKEDENIAPTLYLEGYYKDYEKGDNFFAVCDRIIEAYRDASREKMPDMGFFETYEGVRDKLFCKVINLERNREFLATVPYVECMDLAIVFYIVVNIGNNAGSILIRNEHVSKWKTDIGTLYKDALQNNKEILKAFAYSIEDVLIEMIGKRSDENASELIKMIDGNRDRTSSASMYVLTNREKYYGAACILDEDFLADFSDEIGGDFFILPSSVHELILIPDNGKLESEALRNMVHEVNATQVSPEEILSENIYRFSRKYRKVIPV